MIEIPKWLWVVMCCFTGSGIAFWILMGFKLADRRKR